MRVKDSFVCSWCKSERLIGETRLEMARGELRPGQWMETPRKIKLQTRFASGIRPN